MTLSTFQWINCMQGWNNTANLTFEITTCIKITLHIILKNPIKISFGFIKSK